VVHHLWLDLLKAKVDCLVSLNLFKKILNAQLKKILNLPGCGASMLMAFIMGAAAGGPSVN